MIVGHWGIRDILGSVKVLVLVWLLFQSEPTLRRREPAATRDYVVTSGTRILLRLTNSVNTKASQPGDRLYLRTAVPVWVEGKLIIPQGSYVTARVTESKRAGRVGGRAELAFRFESITLPNGITRDTNSLPGSVDAKGNLDRAEGKIKGDGSAVSDAKTVANTTAAGAGIGSIAGISSGHSGMGAGIGAGAGALGGLIGVMSKRGPDVVLHAGTTMELVLDRDLAFAPDELSPRR